MVEPKKINPMARGNRRHYQPEDEGAHDLAQDRVPSWRRARRSRRSNVSSILLPRHAERATVVVEKKSVSAMSPGNSVTASTFLPIMNAKNIAMGKTSPNISTGRLE